MSQAPAAPSGASRTQREGILHVIATPSWEDFVQKLVDSAWRPGEWRADEMILVAKPDQTSITLRTCARPGCRSVGSCGRKYCPDCKAESKSLGMRVETLPPKSRSEPIRWNQCAVSGTGRRCPLPCAAKGLCRPHRASFEHWAHKHGYDVDDATRDVWLRKCTPVAVPAVACETPGCAIPASGRAKALPVLCDRCARRAAMALGRGVVATRQDWVESQNRRLPARAVDFAVLPVPLARELIYAMQTHDRTGRALLDIDSWTLLTRLIRKTELTTLVGLEVRDAEKICGGPHVRGATSLLRFAISATNAAHRRFVGYDPRVADVIYPQDIDFRETKTRRTPVRHAEPLLLTEVQQEWLREAFRAWLLDIRETYETVRLTFSVCRLASQVLSAEKADNGRDATTLNASAMHAVVRALQRRQTSTDSTKAPTRQTAATRLSCWWRVVDHARRSGLWDHVPHEFSRDPRLHSVKGSQAACGEEGAAVPPREVVAHIRNNLHCLDVGKSTPMARATIAVLIDTGRRPVEVASLVRDCLSTKEDGHWLRWDNHKAERPSRLFPIDRITADVIRSWQETGGRSRPSEKWLFPRPSGHSDDHVSTGTMSSWFRRLMASIPPIGSPVRDVDGVSVLPDLGHVTLYSFRRAYAQRLADQGTAPDVLRVLMDHRSFETTMGYYKVGAARKREAADRVAPLTLDRDGLP